VGNDRNAGDAAGVSVKLRGVDQVCELCGGRWLAELDGARLTLQLVGADEECDRCWVWLRASIRLGEVMGAKVGSTKVVPAQ
jgi:hypothetical protein